MHKSKPRIHIFTGPIDSGKTGRLKREIRKLKERGCRAGGVLSEAIMSEGSKNGYHAVNIATGKRILLVSRAELDSPVRTGKYHFSAGGFEEVSAMLLDSIDCEVLVLDEIGPLELQGKGYAEVLKKILDTFEGLLFLVIRDYLMEDVVRSFGLSDRIEEITVCSANEPVSFEPWS